MKIQVGNKNLTIRKWKGKDKKAFINALKKNDVQQNEIMDVLVYSCIEEDVVLSVDEFRYVLSRIRAYSLGEDISIDFLCSECGTLYTKIFKLKDIIRYTYNGLNEIKVQGHVIELGEIKNKDAYVELVLKDPLYDLLLRVESIDGDDAFTLESLISTFDELDVDVLDEIIDIWESSKFKLDDLNIVTCSNEQCGKETTYVFDELPSFFPESWIS
jgi:hypothetical protein